MDVELFGRLEQKVEELLASYAVLKQENVRLHEENQRLIEARDGVRRRIDAVLEKLERI